MRRTCLVLVLGCLTLLGWPTGARAGESQPQHHRFALVFAFSDCDFSGFPTVLTCPLSTPNGEAAGQIRVTFQANLPLGVGGDPRVTGFWQEDWKYKLRGGTLSADLTTNWSTTAPLPTFDGVNPGFIGFGTGDVTGATGRFAHATGSIEMRFDGTLCICLIDLVL